MNRETITQKRLKELVSYDPDTGRFTLLIASARRPVGTVFTVKYPNHYIKISLDGRAYEAHRLAWFYVHGVFPHRIDHKDRVRTNNKIENLRPATYSQNMYNTPMRRSNTSGFKGVSFVKGRWQASCGVNKKNHYLGSYATPEEASAAYEAFSTIHHGEFKCRE